ncbi:Uncharacterised protein [Serratia fonticola]|uniref:Uncharacterized protein n=1 Tax=Serratia fonticola TaxID=47917 RepID=A0A4U9WR70_SERFO|nr:Uncharacterised protein [Serratia fonticola]
MVKRLLLAAAVSGVLMGAAQAAPLGCRLFSDWF